MIALHEAGPCLPRGAATLQHLRAAGQGYHAEGLASRHPEGI